MTNTSTLDRLAAPMPVSGKLGVVTLWSLWLTAPASILNAYTGIAGVWLPFFCALLGAAIYAARTTNTTSGRTAPKPLITKLGRAAPLMVLLIVALGFVMAMATSEPFWTIVAGTLASALAAGATSTVAATVPRSKNVSGR